LKKQGFFTPQAAGTIRNNISGHLVVVRRIRQSGFEDSNLFADLVGEREDSNPKAKDSNLCCQVKRTQKLLKIVKIWAALSMSLRYQLKIYAIKKVFIRILIQEFAQNLILWTPFERCLH
jgi:hypothetical protein